MIITMCLLLLFSSFAIAFEDNFDDGNADGWEINKNDAGKWSVKGGKLRIEAKEQYSRILTGDKDWTDYTYEVTATRVSGNYPCMLFRAKDFETSYDFEASYSSNTLAVFKGVGDLWNAAEITPGGKAARPPFPGGDTHTYKVTVEGANIKCYLDGKLVMDFKDDNALMSGRIGLASYSNSIIEYENVSVTGRGIPEAIEPGGKLTIVWGALRREVR
jgi:hypothetical protein